MHDHIGAQYKYKRLLFDHFWSGFWPKGAKRVFECWVRRCTQTQGGCILIDTAIPSGGIQLTKWWRRQQWRRRLNRFRFVSKDS